MAELDEAEKRKALVLAAEAVMKEAAARQFQKEWKVEKSQLNQLIGVCAEAVCVDEVRNYLRYQGSRDRAPWGYQLVDETLQQVSGAIDPITGERGKLEAWRHYAVFLARAFTFFKKRAEDEKKNSNLSQKRAGKPRSRG